MDGQRITFIFEVDPGMRQLAPGMFQLLPPYCAQSLRAAQCSSIAGQSFEAVIADQIIGMNLQARTQIEHATP